MSSRREFIKQAGIIGGMTSIPQLTFGGSVSPSLDDYLNATTDEERFGLVRKELLVPAGRIYLNTGSLGPSPAFVIDAVSAAMKQLEMNPVSENWGALGNRMELVRKKVGDFIHADTEEVILTRNTTEGLNLIAQSLDLKKDDEILTTNDEHGGGEVGLEFLVQTKGAVLKRIDMPIPSRSKAEVIQTVLKSITPKTRLIMLSHVNTSTGMLLPFSEISKVCEEKKIFLVADGAQAPGLTSVDVKALNVDAYAASAHKWMLGPKETGFLYLHKRFQKNVQPVFTFSGYGTYSKSSGTRNVATMIGLGAAIDWLTAIGVNKIQQRNLETRNHCLQELRKLEGLTIISPEDPMLSTGIISFTPTRRKNEEIYHALAAHDIIVKVLTKHNGIRISCHMFISKSEIDTFISYLKPLL